jgi:hypothetical protein
MGVVGRLNQYASMQAAEFDDYSMSENLLIYSENISNAAWGKSNSSVSANTITSPDGFSSAYKLIENTANSLHFISQNLGTISGNYSVSCFVKAGERYRGYVQIFGTGGNAAVQFNLQTGTISGGTGTNTITAYPNGWYRVTSTTNFTSAAAVCYFVLLDNTGASTYTGDGTSGIYVWGLQAETGSVATDYTKTVASSKTRILSSTTNTNITGLGTYYSSGFDENVGFTTFLSANISAPYDPVYDEFGGTLFGAGQGRYMRQYTDKSVIVYNEIDEITPIL